MTREAFAEIGDFALLKVKSLEEVGAFLDWGLEKDLFLPFSEQVGRVELGQRVLVYVHRDKADRPCASMKLEKYLSREAPSYTPGEKVELLIADTSPLGFKAIVNGTHMGLLYSNEVFQTLRQGFRLPGYIKKIREDGRIDLLLQPEGNKGADELGQKILEKLKDQGGFLGITDKTDPEIIYKLFGVSKKKFKIALGGLYKKRFIVITQDGIRLSQRE